PTSCASNPAAARPSCRRPTIPRQVMDQEFHLVGQDVAVGQDQVFHPARLVGNGEQRHRGLLRRAPALLQIARETRRNDVLPDVLTAARQRHDVIAGEFPAGAVTTAVQADIAIAREQGGVAERGRRINGAAVAAAAARHDRMQAQDALVATVAVEAAVQGQAGLTQRPRDGFADIKACRILPADPVEDAPARVEREHAGGVQVRDDAGRMIDGAGCVRVHGSRSIEQIAKRALAAVPQPAPSVTRGPVSRYAWKTDGSRHPAREGLTGMADVFVSYARADKARVAPLVAAIEAKGWSVWWDPEITPGQEFDDQIDAEIDAAKAVLVIWTPASVASRWVRGEAREAAERGILVPVRFEQARLPMDVRAIHTTDLDEWHEDPSSVQAQEFLRALAAMIARSQATQSTTAGSASASSPSAGESKSFSVCVLPFVNMSGDSEQEYFSDGITEDIITDLSKVSALAVASSNSAFMYKGKHVDIQKVVRELKVTHVLEGSVRKAGGRVRINAQLIDGATNNHVWAERYDRDASDIFAIQDEISQAIVKALRLRLLPEEKKAIERRGTDSADAHNLYLMARQAYVTSQDMSTRSSDAIIRLCVRATEIDPRYAQAWP